MSRTYRRKNEGWDNYCINEWIYTDKLTVEKIYYPKDSIEYKKGMARYHSDTLMTMAQVPKWYKIHFCRRPFRRKEKAALNKVRKYRVTDLIWEDYSINFPKPVKDALYYW